MPELHFKGKEYVYNHSLTIPYQPQKHTPTSLLGMSRKI